VGIDFLRATADGWRAISGRGASLIFQILDANYTYSLDKKPLVQLFGRTPDGSPITCQVSGFRPYFYVGPYEGRLDSVREELMRMGLQTEAVKKFEPMFYQPQPTEMLKVTLDNPKEVRDLREEVKGIQHVKAVYETDIAFKNRFLVDKGIGGMSWVETGKLRRDEPVDVKSLKKATREGNAPLKFMSFDIECLPGQGGMPDPKESPVILTSMAS
jgi:DNA polymerase I